MKTLSIILMLVLIGCTEKPTPVKETKVETVQMRKKKKRYICGEKTIVVANIDSGFTFSSDTKNVRLCNYGHRDFSSIRKFNGRYTKTPVPVDSDKNLHGTNIAGLIQDFGGYANFCMVILKYYNPDATGQQNLDASVAAVKYATRIKADFINYSGGGQLSDEAENTAIKKYLDQGGKIVAAAGNEAESSDIAPFYPAMSDPRIISVGSTDMYGRKLPSSNYGPKVTKWEVGHKMKAFGIRLTGTSQAAAVTTGKIIRKECINYRLHSKAN
jgi:subtilisin family serine protease